MTFEKYSEIAESKRVSIISEIRRSDEQRKLTSKISKKQWSECSENDKNARIKKTKIGMKNSEKYQNRDFHELKTDEYKQMKSGQSKELWANRSKEEKKELTNKIKQTRMDNGGYIVTNKTRKLLSMALKRKHIEDPEFHNSVVKKLLTGKSHSTKIELKVADFIKKNKLPYKHVKCDTEFMIANMIPDFVNTNGEKKVIEVNGCYWHGCKKCYPGGSKHTKDDSKKRIAKYKEYGYDCTIVWEHEFKDNKWQDKIIKQEVSK
jgi:G:T-mismatch repair DNA endonuclease (very short patch repair protein)